MLIMNKFFILYTGYQNKICNHMFLYKSKAKSFVLKQITIFHFLQGHDRGEKMVRLVKTASAASSQSVSFF